MFRRDRHGERELLAALRVSRVQACATDSFFGVQCGPAADAQDEEADWDARVERLQVRSCVVFRHKREFRDVKASFLVPDAVARAVSAGCYPCIPER